MPEFLQLLPPDEARTRWLNQVRAPLSRSEAIPTADALGRVTAVDIHAPHPLPQFDRSAVDGYAVRARDTFGASDGLPTYLTVIGEVPMGQPTTLTLGNGEAALVHTGGMLPRNADAVVMLEHTQRISAHEIEVLRPVAAGENVLLAGEDVAAGAVVIPAHTLIRPAEIGGLMALGITEVQVLQRPVVGLISSGDEVIPADQTPAPGQVRDINAHTLAALARQCGASARHYGITPDQATALRARLAQALEECDAVAVTAGSSASTRDMTAEVIHTLGAPGVLVHGINTRPGKPTILAVCNGKAVLGLPGNPVSALTNGYLFLVPLVEHLLGLSPDRVRPVLSATLSVNLPSQAGREDWVPARLCRNADGGWIAEPIFGKSNFIFNLVAAQGLIKIPADATGLDAGARAEVHLL